jgi:nucleoside-diphosphate-sugar epimerase
VSGTTLVTGATGFVGRHLSALLVQEGAAVRGLIRPGAGALAAGVEAAPAEGLHDVDGVRRAVRGVDTVVHLAARVHVMRESAADPEAEFRRVNVEGTRVLLRAAAEAGVRRFVFASSVKALGEHTDRPWTDDTPPAPADPYGRSKLAAEALVREASAHMHTVSLRLPLVYGPGMKGNMRSLFRVVERGAPLPLGGVRNRRSLLYVGNLAAAVRAVLASPAARGQSFVVSDGHDLSTPELVRAIAAALGRPARLVPVPAAFFRAAGRLGNVLAPLGFPLNSAAVERLMGSLQVDCSRLREACGYAPPFTVAEGLAETALWFRGATRRAA